MRIGLVTCVRDEAEVLTPFLVYHRALGVERAYVYVDRSRDGTLEIARALPGVEAIERDRRSDEPDILYHQNACANDALERARSDGIDWLLHLDVDEYAWAGNDAHSAVERGDLRSLLRGVAPSTEAVVLRSLELVPRADLDGAAFWRLHDVQDEHVLERDVLDPSAGVVRRLTRRLGHDLGKSIVRVTADVQAGTPHQWTRRQDGAHLPALQPIPTERRGWHYHFVVRGARHWYAKYGKLAADPPRWPRGSAVEFPKQAWKEAAARMSAGEAERYARQWVLVDPAIVAAAQQRGILRRAADVEAVLREVGFLARARTER